MVGQQNLTDQAFLINSLSPRTLDTAQFENLTDTVLGSRDTELIKKFALKELTVVDNLIHGKSCLILTES